MPLCRKIWPISSLVIGQEVRSVAIKLRTSFKSILLMLQKSLSPFPQQTIFHKFIAVEIEKIFPFIKLNKDELT